MSISCGALSLVLSRAASPFQLVLGEGALSLFRGIKQRASGALPKNKNGSALLEWAGFPELTAGDTSAAGDAEADQTSGGIG